MAVAMWFLFSLICWFIMPAYARMSTNSEAVINDVITYGRIVCVFSFGLFLESIWTKVLQANGDMKTPMVAQIMGAITNIILDPLLIFGMFGFPKMGIGGAAVATVAGQIIAALIVSKKGSEISCKRSVSETHRKNISSGCTKYPDAIGIYLLHIRTKFDFSYILRSSGHSVGTIL